MIGASGVGKTAFFLYPNLEYACATGMSFLCYDTKGDLFRTPNSVLYHLQSLLSSIMVVYPSIQCEDSLAKLSGRDFLQRFAVDFHSAVNHVNR